MRKTPREQCPNCLRLVDGLVSTGEIAEQFMGVTHCGCYYDEVGSGATHTYLTDAALWHALPPRIARQRKRCEALAMTVQRMMTEGTPYDFGHLEAVLHAHAELHEAYSSWERARNGNVEPTVCLCGVKFGRAI